MLKNHTHHSVYYVALHNRILCEHNNKWNAWVADNLAPLHMPFLSIIAKYNSLNKSQNYTSTFVY